MCSFVYSSLSLLAVTLDAAGPDAVGVQTGIFLLIQADNLNL